MGNHPTFEERVNALFPEVLRDLQESALLRAEENKLLGLDPKAKAKAKAQAEAQAEAQAQAETKKLLIGVASYSHPHQPRIGAPKGPSGVRNPANDARRKARKDNYLRQYVWQGLDFTEMGQLIVKSTAPAVIVSPQEIARRAQQSAAAKAANKARAEAKKAEPKAEPTPKRGPKTKAAKAKNISTLPDRVPCERVGEIPVGDLEKRQERAWQLRAMRRQERATQLHAMHVARTLARRGITRLLTEEEKKENFRKDAEKNEFYRVNRKEKREFFAFDFTAMVEGAK